MNSEAEILRLENLKFPELDVLDRERTLFLLAVSPLEQHGPHLPIGVDAFTATHFAETLARQIKVRYPEWHVILIPTLHLGCSGLDQVGTINIRQRVVRDAVVDSLGSLARYHFKYFIIVNGHGGPGHVVALEEAARKVSRKYRSQAISITGGLAYRFLDGRYAKEIDALMEPPMSEEHKSDLKYDSHAGQWETAMMLKLKPELVDPNYRDLPAVKISKWKKFRPNYAFSEGRRGYTGFPARAEVAFAEASEQVLLQKALEIVEKMLGGEDVRKMVASPIWKYPFFRTNFFVKLFGSFIILLVFLGLLYWMGMI